MNERTPFQNHLNITNVTPTQAAGEITCQIGGTLRATVKNINLAPSDMIKLLTSCRLTVISSVLRSVSSITLRALRVKCITV